MVISDRNALGPASINTLEHIDSARAIQLSVQMFDELQRDLSNFKINWANRIQIESDSRIAKLNEMLPLVLFSSQIESLIQSSIDCLEQLLPYIQQTLPWPAVAHYSLLRSAIETSSTALWLVSIRKRNKQAWESLRLTYHDNDRMVDLAKTFKVSNDVFMERKKRILSILENIPDYSNHNIKKRIWSVDIIRNADNLFRFRGVDSIEGVIIWNVCSDFLHGNRSILPLLSEARFVRYSATGVDFKLTTSLLPAAQFARTIMLNCTRFLEIYGELRRSGSY